MAKLSCGIIGLPNVGKSTLFTALTACEVPASNYPFCTIDKNVGLVEVIDPRLDILSKLSGSRKILYAVSEFVDIAGLVAGASKGEGLGNKFLANIRETDALIHVVRCFEDENITHVSGKVSPKDDIEIINLELALADLQMLENTLPKLEKEAKKDPKKYKPLIDLLKRVKEWLDSFRSVRQMELSEEELALLKPYPFLTLKKVLYLMNVKEDMLPDPQSPLVDQVKAIAALEGMQTLPICCQLEAEIAQLPKEEQITFLQELGLKESGLTRLIHASFDLLGLITYLTTGEMETRAWTIHKGTPAVEAAGEIHSDIQKGFIRAEVIAFDDMVKYGGRVQARQEGKVRLEGKEYIVKDGDVILFMHN
jgi:ribosome-binding ATPase